MLALTIYKLVTVRRQGMSRRSTFLSTILRDGIWAFFLVFGVSALPKIQTSLANPGARRSDYDHERGPAGDERRDWASAR